MPILSVMGNGGFPIILGNGQLDFSIILIMTLHILSQFFFSKLRKRPNAGLNQRNNFQSSEIVKATEPEQSRTTVRWIHVLQEFPHRVQFDSRSKERQRFDQTYLDVLEKSSRIASKYHRLLWQNFSLPRFILLLFFFLLSLLQTVES